MPLRGESQDEVLGLQSLIPGSFCIVTWNAESRHLLIWWDIGGLLMMTVGMALISAGSSEGVGLPRREDIKEWPRAAI